LPQDQSGSKSEALRVLLVEDSELDAELVTLALSRGPRELRLERVQDGLEMEPALDRAPWDIVISDWSLPSFSAPMALELLKRKQPDLPFIIVSGTVGEENAVAAMRAGANDYLLKDRLTRLLPAVERELREARLRREAHEALRASEDALRHSQEQFFQAQKMEAVGRLAGGVAHDFNNALSVVMTYADLLLLDIAQDSPMRTDLEEIRRAAERAASLTRQLLVFSRQQLLEPKVLDLNELIRDAAKMLQRVVGEELAINLQLEPELGAVRVDPGQMEQVLVNLAGNARDAMPNGGQITIRTANFDLGDDEAREHPGAQAGPHVEIAISDTGIGMDAATLARAFEPFFTTKPHGKGAGLGLATVFGIAQQSGGYVWVASASGEGSTFRFLLPRVPGLVSESQRTVETIADLAGSETILLVEDDVQVLTVVRNILARLGYQVLVAHNAGEAMLIAEKHSGDVHLLLTDVVMPYVSGPELGKRLMALRPGMHVLFMSGYSDESLVPPELIASGLAFLQKPITPERLGKKLREVLGRSGASA
jgi:two-component system cell cycle sensor histidine kinase/response regulator CckA